MTNEMKMNPKLYLDTLHLRNVEAMLFQHPKMLNKLTKETAVRIVDGLDRIDTQDDAEVTFRIKLAKTAINKLFE